MALPPLGNSDHVVFSVSIDFPISSKQDALYHALFDYSHADWDGLRDHLRDVPREDIFKPLKISSNFVSGFRLELMYISLILSIRSNLTHLHGFHRSKRILEAAKLAYATKTKESITSQKLGSRDFWRVANSVLNKGKSAIPPLFNRL